MCYFYHINKQTPPTRTIHVHTSLGTSVRHRVCSLTSIYHSAANDLHLAVPITSHFSIHYPTTSYDSYNNSLRYSDMLYTLTSLPLSLLCLPSTYSGSRFIHYWLPLALCAHHSQLQPALLNLALNPYHPRDTSPLNPAIIPLQFSCQ